MTKSHDQHNPLWSNQENWWEWQSSNSWNTSFSIEKQSPIIYQTLTETMTTLNQLQDHPRSHLFLGVNPESGATEMFDLKRPRSFIIDDNNHSARNILQTIVLALKKRKDQRNFPVTVLTNDPESWRTISGKHLGVSIRTSSSWDGEAANTIRQLVYNDPRKPHFLVVDNLADLLWLDTNSESALKILISSGAADSKVYVLASRGPTRNIKSENVLDEWTDHGNVFHAETTVIDTLVLENGRVIHVPDPI